MDNHGRANLCFETWSSKCKYERHKKCNICTQKKYYFQLRVLRRNVDDHGDALVDNYRPTQALNSRVVNYYRV